ncbi:MAG: RNA 2',3'-cyclic phosphodiesterase [Fervidicoccaceae archaeon]
MRLFVSIDVENPDLVAKISELKSLIDSVGAPVKLVEDENLHVTLAFIGEVPEVLVDRVRNCLARVSRPSFSAHLRGLGAFPSPQRPRVLWVGIEEGRAELEELHRAVSRNLISAGVGFRGSSFEPHVTIGRVKGARNIAVLTKILEQYSDFEVGWLKVSEFRLKRSVLTPRGPIYSTLASFPLQ